MKFGLRREILLAPLRVVAPVAPGKPMAGQPPATSHLLLDIDKGSMSLTATDGENRMSAAISSDFKATRAGSVAIEASTLLQICQHAPVDAELQFEVKNSTLHIQGKDRHYNLPMLDADSLLAQKPNTPEGDDVLTFEISAESLGKALDRVRPFMAATDWRNYLVGTLFDIQAADGTACVVATDSHRMATVALSSYESTDKTDSRERVQAIVPRMAVSHLLRLLGSGVAEGEEGTMEVDAEEKQQLPPGSKAEVKIGDNQMRVEVAGYTFWCQLINARYPDYAKVLPDGKDQQKIVISRGDFKQALEGVIFLSGENRSVTLDLNNSNIRITTGDTSNPTASVDMPINEVPTELKIGFNAGYLLDALNGITSENLEIHYYGEAKSVEMRQPGDPDLRYVIMPLRL